MQKTAFILALAGFATTARACDALECAKTTIQDAAVGTCKSDMLPSNNDACWNMNYPLIRTIVCIAAGAISDGAVPQNLCSMGIKIPSDQPCQGCGGGTGCDPQDEKAYGKACGPGNLAQLGPGRCVQAKSSVPHPDANTDIVDGDYVVHCVSEALCVEHSTHAVQT